MKKKICFRMSIHKHPPMPSSHYHCNAALSIFHSILNKILFNSRFMLQPDTANLINITFLLWNDSIISIMNSSRSHCIQCKDYPQGISHKQKNIPISVRMKNLIVPICSRNLLLPSSFNCPLVKFIALLLHFP